MTRHRWTTAIAITLSLALGLVACGSDPEDDGDSGGIEKRREMIERLPARAAGASRVFVADLAQARDVLQLPDDADPSKPERDQESLRFATGAAIALPHLQSPMQNPVGEALDEGRIKLAVSNGMGVGGTTIISTSQPWGQIRERLRKRGFRPVGKALVTDADPTAVAYRRVREDDGFVVLESLAERSRSSKATPRHSAEAGELAGELDGPIVVAWETTSDCVRALGATSSLKKRGTELVLMSDDPDAVTTPGNRAHLPPGLRLGKVHRGGDRIRIEATQARGEGTPVSGMLGEIRHDAIWTCR